MKNPFQPGDIKTYAHVVSEADIARFATGEVHPVYATFAVARDAEWSGRLFVLEMKEEDEEGIGTAIEVLHYAPALVGQEVLFTAILKEVNGDEVVTSFDARCGERLIARGTQRQRILKKERLDEIFSYLRKGG